ncbi:helix-turn-helix domain-containing protein [Methylobacterium sp. A54F]
MLTTDTYTEASARCAAAKPNRLVRSSRDFGWTSLLVDEHEGRGRSEIFDTHRTADVTLVVATRGAHRVEVFKHGRWHEAVYQPGAAGLTPPHEATRLRWSSAPGDETFRTANLYLPAGLIAAIADEYRRIGRPSPAQPLSALVFRDPMIASGVSALLGALDVGAPDLYAEQVGRWIATHLLSRHAGHWPEAEETRQPEIITDRRLARVLDFMSAHLGEPLTLGQLAREAGISVHHFGRRFRERFGQTPHGCLTTMRMDTAQRLLRTTDLPVADVAFACGYTRPAAFAAAFLRHVGATPRAFRRTSASSPGA